MNTLKDVIIRLIEVEPDLEDLLDQEWRTKIGKDLDDNRAARAEIEINKQYRIAKDAEDVERIQREGRLARRVKELEERLFEVDGKEPTIRP